MLLWWLLSLLLHLLLHLLLTHLLGSDMLDILRHTHARFLSFLRDLALDLGDLLLRRRRHPRRNLELQLKWRLLPLLLLLLLFSHCARELDRPEKRK